MRSRLTITVLTVCLGLGVLHAQTLGIAQPQTVGALTATTVAIGTNPATTGAIRLSYNTSIVSRDSSGTANIALIGNTNPVQVDAIQLGDSGRAVVPFSDNGNAFGAAANRWSQGFFVGLTATTVNGNTITTGTGTLTLAAGKTLTANNSLTLAGTDATVMTFPTTSATIARTDAANTFTGAQTFSGRVAGVNGVTTAGTNGLGVVAGATGLLSAQAANIVGTNLIASVPVGGGLYQVCGFIAVTQAATTSSTLPSIVITFNNGVAQTLTLTPTNAGNTLTTYQQACGVVQASAATALNYSTTGYVSTGVTPLQYQLNVSAVAIY